jgi:hypothetical protein
MYRVEKYVRMEAIHASFARATRMALAAAIVAAFGASAGVASAGAATGCTGLQAALEHAGSGATVVLDGMCTGSYTLPANAAFTLEGASGTPSGFDGTGAIAPLLGNLASTESGAMTLSHLTFEHAKDVSALSIRASQVTLSDDSFLENEEEGSSEHAAFVQISSCPPAGGPAITLTGSTFSSNKLILGPAPGGGAGAWLEDSCEPSRAVLEDNTFTGNMVKAAGTAAEAEVAGGGLQLRGPASQPTAVSQRGNVFDSNSAIGEPPAIANYGGGGEWLVNASLLSVDDRFSRNTISGTTGASPGFFNWSWGAGLGVDGLGTSYCTAPNLIDSTLEDAVVEGNTIEPGISEDLGGGGIWVGCSHFDVLDSTVTLNTAPNGAGIEGEPGDQLELANSIVAEGSGANEIAGFNEWGGSVATSFSDVCKSAGSSEPLPGAGNICADPLLADNGDPVSFDVHETASSPTIDAGSNALVPSGLTTDAFGTPRILPGQAGCTGSFPAVVDMGAAEFVPAPPSCPAPTQEQVPVLTAQERIPTSGLPTKEQIPAPGLTVQKQALAPPLAHFVSLKLSSTGIGLRLSCASTDGQGCSGTIYVTTDETLQGKKVLAVDTSKRTKTSVRIGQASFSLPAGATATFHVKLNSTGLELLRHFHAFSAWVLANEAMPSDSQVIFLLHSARLSEPTQKRKPNRQARHSKSG